MSERPGPTLRRRMLARELQRLRLAAGYESLEMAAQKTGLHRSSLSRIEAAKQAILPRTVRLLCSAYGVEAAEAELLVARAETSDDRAWFLAIDETMPAWLERYIGEERDAAAIKAYHPELVPGLLQTAAYCMAVITAYGGDLDSEAVAARMAGRRARQGLLHGPRPPDVHVVLSEAVLLRSVGGPDVMREQLYTLIEVAGHPCVTIQVLPFSAGAHPAMAGAFTMLSFPVEVGASTIFVEVDSGALYRDRAQDVYRYEWAFTRLTERALSPADSVELIGKVAAEA